MASSKKYMPVMLADGEDLTAAIKKCLAARRGETKKLFCVVIVTTDHKTYLYPLSGGRSYKEAQNRAWKLHARRNLGRIGHSYTFGNCQRKHCRCGGRYWALITVKTVNGSCPWEEKLSRGDETTLVEKLELFIWDFFAPVRPPDVEGAA